MGSDSDDDDDDDDIETLTLIITLNRGCGIEKTEISSMALLRREI